VSWQIEFTSGVRVDLVGLDSDATETLTSTLVTWLRDGPPQENRRTLLGMNFYEAVVAERYLLAYVVDDEHKRFVLLWLRHRPSAAR
jgi:hypothetical protein